VIFDRRFILSKRFGIFLCRHHTKIRCMLEFFIKLLLRNTSELPCKTAAFCTYLSFFK
jgi:hypothetical protein